MRDNNPYQSPDERTPNPHVSSEKPRSKSRWALIGFVLGAAPPLAYGVYGMQQHYSYVAASAPGEAACATGALRSLAVIFVISPFIGLIGAGSGWAASGFHWRT